MSSFLERSAAVGETFRLGGFLTAKYVATDFPVLSPGPTPRIALDAQTDAGGRHSGVDLVRVHSPAKGSGQSPP
jgi:hypothetical protein